MHMYVCVMISAQRFNMQGINSKLKEVLAVIVVRISKIWHDFCVNVDKYVVKKEGWRRF